MDKIRIVADAGGTKTDWCVIKPDGSKPLIFSTPGINVATQSFEKVTHGAGTLAHYLLALGVINDIKTAPPIEMFFYGAGLNSFQQMHKIYQGLKKYFKVLDSSRFESDLMGVAKAIFNDRPGIACILGTGSASGYFQGDHIDKSIPSLGYIAGDEGSGSFLGKSLVNAFFKEELPVAIKRQLEIFTDMSYSTVVELIYHSDSPAGYLASFVPFIKKFRSDPFISQLISSSLKLFFTKNVLKYKEVNSVPVGFCGGVASVFEKELRDIAAELNITVADVISRPIERLAQIYSKS